MSTVKKNGLITDLQSFTALNKTKLEEILAKIPQIYASVNLLIRKKDFLVVPEDFYDSDPEMLFRLSFELLPEETIFMDKLEHRLGTVYPVDTDLYKVLHSKFSTLKIQNEASVILSKLFREIGLKSTRILLSVNNGHLVIIAMKGDALQLCNSYRIKSEQDIFYFVMLAVEQLQFPQAETDLVFLGRLTLEPELKAMFKDYMNDVIVWNDNYKLSSDIKNSEALAQSFALQTLVCE